jgi:hypothetical protein
LLRLRRLIAARGCTRRVRRRGAQIFGFRVSSPTSRASRPSKRFQNRWMEGMTRAAGPSGRPRLRRSFALPEPGASRIGLTNQFSHRLDDLPYTRAIGIFKYRREGYRDIGRSDSDNWGLEVLPKIVPGSRPRFRRSPRRFSGLLRQSPRDPSS